MKKTTIKVPSKPKKATSSIDSNTSSEGTAPDNNVNFNKARRLAGGMRPGSGEFIFHRKGEDVKPRLSASTSQRKSSSGRPIGSIMESQRGSVDDDYINHDVDKRFDPGHKDGLSPLQTTLQKFDPSTSWETWWIHSPAWRRKLVFFIIILAILAILQFLAAIGFFFTPMNVHDPYICESPKCRQLSKWISSSSDHSEINPCTDFYKFSCNHHKKSDVGDLFAHWYDNFARLESDGENGESILAKILTKPADEDIIAQRIVKFYQVCLNVWTTKTIELDVSLTTLIRHVFHDFDLWGGSGSGVKEVNALERAAKSMVDLLGDYGFFKTLAPVGYPDILIETWKFTSYIKSEHVRRFLPIIYSALNITGKKNRDAISKNLYYMGHKLDALNKGNHNTGCALPSNFAIDPEVNFDFKIPFYLAYHGEDNIDTTTDPWTLKNDKLLDIKLDPLGWDPITENYEQFEKEWNCWMQKRFHTPENKRFMRASYATFWGLRLLVELVHDADKQTAVEYDLVSNPFFTVYTKLYDGRQMESRCYESLLSAMGYYPIFAYFDSDENQRLTTFEHYQDAAVQIIKHAAAALLEQFAPLEEGGMPYVSSRYRERAYRALSGVDLNHINILVPLLDDDPTFIEDPTQESLAVGESHIQNIINWREFTFLRTKHFWLKKSPQGRLVWYKDFYFVDHATVYESPSATVVPILNIPPALLVFPYLNNDMEIANYAGGRVLAAKLWLKLLQFDFSDRNVNADIARKKEDGDLYREGVVTDADYEPCEVVTYNWFHPADDSERKRRHKLTPFDPHFLAFRYGRRIYGDQKTGLMVERGMGAFSISLALRTMLKKYYEEVVNGLRERDFSEFSEEQWTRLMHQKLINHENYTESQLFFLLTFREMCRSYVSADVYFSHIAENVAALTHMKEFGESWRCPPNSPMNPVNKCFR